MPPTALETELKPPSPLPGTRLLTAPVTLLLPLVAEPAALPTLGTTLAALLRLGMAPESELRPGRAPEALAPVEHGHSNFGVRAGSGGPGTSRVPTIAHEE